MAIFFEFGFEELVVGIADYVFEEVLLLNLNETHFEFLLLDKLQIFVDSLKSEIHSLRLVVLHKITLVGEKILSRHILVFFKEMCDRPHIGADGIRCQILARKE